MNERPLTGAFLIKVICGMILSCTAMLALISEHTYSISPLAAEIQLDIDDGQCNNLPFSESEEREELEDMMLLWSSHSYINADQRNPAMTNAHVWAHPRIITPPPEPSLL